MIGKVIKFEYNNQIEEGTIMEKFIGYRAVDFYIVRLSKDAAFKNYAIQNIKIIKIIN